LLNNHVVISIEKRCKITEKKPKKQIKKAIKLKRKIGEKVKMKGHKKASFSTIWPTSEKLAKSHNREN